jgi:NAD(P)-dependent dehydrogenase (short-subunit alcohol dehydrogenase family)
MVQQVEQVLGPIDLLVNNAGIGGPVGPFLENDPDDWWRCQEVNLRGPMLCCHQILPRMMAPNKVVSSTLRVPGAVWPFRICPHTSSAKPR